LNDGAQNVQGFVDEHPMLTLIAAILFLVVCTVVYDTGRGVGSLRRLPSCPEWAETDAPRVSIIVAACNEENTIEAGLRSLVEQSYPHLEIVVVNDRSTDRTGEILKNVARQCETLRPVEVDSLPAGWLGKNHALARGAALATGEILLFTDADVRFDHSAVSRAVSVLQKENLDHLCITFDNSGGGALLNALIIEASMNLLFLFKPWKAADAHSRIFTGIGAFNMVRREAYRAVGGHDALKMQVIDDVFLGKLIKRHGFTQDCLLGAGYLRVSWYATVPEMIDGLMKNCYATFNYRPSLAVLGAGLSGILTVVPQWGMMIAEPPAQVLFGAAFGVRLIALSIPMVINGYGVRGIVALLLTPYLICYIIIRAMAMAERRGAVSWRGSVYDLAELRRQEWLFSGYFRWPWTAVAFKQ
jgi:glycosyltransferase involved in cell wall biosynthesis